MSKIVVGTDLAAQLVAEVGRVELCDPDGKVLGAFVPKPDPQLYDLEPKFSDEELRQLDRADGPWLTTDEVVRQLLEKR